MFKTIATRFEISVFLILTTLFSLVAFLFMLQRPELQTPENPEALPLWLVAVYSPTVAALLTRGLNKKLKPFLKRCFSRPPLSPWLLLTLLPVLATAVVMAADSNHVTPVEGRVTPGTVLLLLAFNLVLGPLGEEAGWRGLMYPRLKDRFGWMASALLVALAWSLWHAPLWLIDSPQSQIGFGVFTAHVFCYSIIAAIITNGSRGSIWPAIVLHLLINAASGYAILAGYNSIGRYYSSSLWVWIPLTLVSMVLYELLAVKDCITTRRSGSAGNAGQVIG